MALLRDPLDELIADLERALPPASQPAQDGRSDIVPTGRRPAVSDDVAYMGPPRRARGDGEVSRC